MVFWHLLFNLLHSSKIVNYVVKGGLANSKGLNTESYSWTVMLQRKNLPFESFSPFEVKITALQNSTTSIHKNVIEVIAVLFQVIFSQCGIIWWQFSCYFGIGKSFTSIIFILLFRSVYIIDKTINQNHLLWFAISGFQKCFKILIPIRFFLFFDLYDSKIYLNV